MPITPEEFQTRIKRYLLDSGPDTRHASFDFAFSYFQGFRDRPHELATSDNLRRSCLEIGFYLASWGMFRPSSFLLQRNVRVFIPLIRWIARQPEALWNIDVPAYTDDNIGLLLSAAVDIRTCLGDRTSDTLVTKILLGVFGCTPAFDEYFRRAFDVYSFNRKNLEVIRDFYAENRAAINAAAPVRCRDFQTGEATGVLYTKAKLIDMYGLAQA